MSKGTPVSEVSEVSEVSKVSEVAQVPELSVEVPGKAEGAELVVQVARVAREGSPEVPLPRYQTDGAAGMDLHAALPAPITLAPLARALVPTGLRLAIPRGYEGQVRPRSGLALERGITVLNAPGTVDADYRGEVKVLLVNLGPEPVAVAPLERIAQIVFARHGTAALVEVAALDETARGQGGYGSTGAA